MRQYLEGLIDNANQNPLLISKSQRTNKYVRDLKNVHMVEDIWIVIVQGLFLWTYKWMLSLLVTYVFIYLGALLLFSCSVVSNFLRPHGPQHARLSCPSPSPGVCSNSCPLSQWCCPTISSSVIPFSSCPQSFPASGVFQWVDCKHQVAKVLELQLQHQSFQRIFRIDFLSNRLVWFPRCPRDSQDSSPARLKASIPRK